MTTDEKIRVGIFEVWLNRDPGHRQFGRWLVSRDGDTVSIHDSMDEAVAAAEKWNAR